MKLLAVVTPPSIYHGCSTQKTFWEEKFTGKEHLFLDMNMKNCGRHNVSKHKDIKGSDKYVTLDIFRVKIEIGDIRKGVNYLSGFQDQSKVAKI